MACEKVKPAKPFFGKLPPRCNYWWNKKLEKWIIIARPVGRSAATLPGLPWSPDFMAAHAAAMAGTPMPPRAIGASRTIAGTLDAAVIAFYDWPKYQAMGKAQQVKHRQVLDKFRQQETETNAARGQKQLAALNFETLQEIFNDMPKAHPQRHLKNALRALFKFCKKTGRVAVNPMHEIETMAPKKTGGFKPWDETHVEQFRTTYKVGTLQRLALEVILNTGLRGCDAVRLGRAHLKEGGTVHVIKPSKTENRTNMEVKIPVHPFLRQALDAMPPRAVKPGEVTPLNYLLTPDEGKPFTASYFQQWFGKACAAIGLDFDVRAHGLRKLICIRLVSYGLSAHEIGAVIGDKNLRVIQRYCEQFDREKAAAKAMATLIAADTAADARQVVA